MAVPGFRVFWWFDRFSPLQLIVGLVALACLLPADLHARQESSFLAPLSQHGLLLDGTLAGDVLVAVGERGHILRSSDSGASWRQVEVPTRSTLTAVSFLDDKLGFAVGHDAIILRSRDGGESWHQVHAAPEEERPLLDVHIHSAQKIIGVGAYGLYLESDDGGTSWVSRQFVAVDLGETATTEGGGDEVLPEDFHLNQLNASDTGKWYIAAEAGMIYRSDDHGRHWYRLPSPYEGSFFGVLPLSMDKVLLFGLQGRLFASVDSGEAWQRVETRTQAALTTGVELGDGRAVIAGYSGTVLSAAPGEIKFSLAQLEQRMGISSIIALDGGEMLALGTGGTLRLPPSLFQD